MLFGAIFDALSQCREWVQAAGDVGVRFSGDLAGKIDAAFQEMASTQVQCIRFLLEERASVLLGVVPRQLDRLQPEDWMARIQQQIGYFTDGPSPGLVDRIEDWDFDTKRLAAIGALALAALESRARVKARQEQAAEGVAS